MAKEGVGIDINNGDINWEEFRIQNPELNEFEKIAQRELIKYIQLDWRHDITKKLDIYDKADNINIEAIFPCPEIISILDKKSQSLIALNWKDDYKRLKDFYNNLGIDLPKTKSMYDSIEKQALSYLRLGWDADYKSYILFWKSMGFDLSNRNSKERVLNKNDEGSVEKTKNYITENHDLWDKDGFILKLPEPVEVLELKPWQIKLKKLGRFFLGTGKD